MPTSARAANAAAVLRAVLLHGPVPRTRIAELSGLSPATVTRLLPLLAERGLVRELDGPDAAQTLGRPRVPVDLDASGWAVLGVHIGVRRSVFGLLDLRGRWLGASELEHEDPSPDAVIEQACARLRSLRGRVVGPRRLLGLGVITGGRIDAETGILESQPGLGWRDVDLRDEFARRTGLPVHVDEHVRAMAAAESLFGRTRQARSVGYLYVGNVVGFAYSVDGVVHRGSHAAAGDVTHLPLGLDAGCEPCSCGSWNCFLGRVGERAVTEQALRLGVIPEPCFELVVKAARAGDEQADRLLRERARGVGAAVSALAGILDPELFVVAGRGLTEAAEYLPDLDATVHRPGAAPVAIVPTAFGPHVNAVAAATLVIDRVVRDPLGAQVRP